jgi:predicted XRE-type DNA-binding protein
MGKRYQSVSDVVRELTSEKDFRKEFDHHVASKALSKTLFALRCKRGISQAEIAEKLNCNQSRIAKIENSKLDEIKVSDLVEYAKALGLKMSMRFYENMIT